MDTFEKVEKLVEKANVTYEEAKDALEQCGWDLLDAMVYLERAGKVHGPKESSYSTDYEDQANYVRVEETVEEQKKKTDSQKSWQGNFQSILREFFGLIFNNFLCILHKGEVIFKLPVWAALLIFLATWHVTLPVGIAALFFGVRYSFEGRDAMKGANDFMDKASEMAEHVKEKWNDDVRKTQQ